MAKRKCEHSDVRHRYRGLGCIFLSQCNWCGERVSLGPSNDEPVAVQVEMRAAEIAGSNRSDDGWPRDEHETSETSGYCDHFTGADRAPGEDYKSWNSGWLSSEIRHHDTNRDATAWSWSIDRPLAEQDVNGEIKAFLDRALQPSPFQPQDSSTDESHGHGREVLVMADKPEDPCPTPLTRQLLERFSVRPTSPTATVSITPKCHRDSGVKIGYSWTDGCAVLRCSTCGAGVARLQLANEVPS